MGDRLLCSVAQRLTSEVVRHGDVVARLGGDEFALLLPQADEATARALAQRIADSFECALSLDDQTVDLSAGVGIACWPSHADNADDLLVRAEVAMYAAKHRHEPSLVYDLAMDSSSALNLSLLSELRRAVDAGELRLYLQPKIALRSRRLVGAEGLVRWQHPQRGMVQPMDFIPFAEQTGFVRQLTLWIFEEAARQWEHLQTHGPVRISINLSTRDLLDLELPQKLINTLKRYGAPESGFCLEITESAIMDDPARAEATLNTLRQCGFKLSIDDFGTGYSSLAYLRKLPVDELKIDRSFVLGLQSNADDAKIVRSTIDLAHNLGLSVVAEGIENEAVFAQLAALNCDEGQGYHMSRPLPVADFVAWAARWNAQHLQADEVVTEEAVAA
jgi:predicted signal transduction protein with EAL and GGDEF domain